MARTKKAQATYRVGEQVYSADTVTQAKEQAKEHAEWLLTGDWSPRFLSHRGHDLIMWRGCHSWEYRIIYPDQKAEGGCYAEGTQARLWANSADRNERESWARAKNHFAQVTWEHADGAEDSSFPAWVERVEDRKELVRWAQFQVKYKALRAEGFDDTQAHAMACGWNVDSNGRTLPQSSVAA